MKKKLLSLVLVAVMVFCLGVTAMAFSEEPVDGVVITGVALRAEDENYVDASLFSQYETVTFSDGSSQTINVDEETFVLTIDGTVVDLDNPDNWTEGAVLSVVKKSMSDTISMSMNQAFWGPFYFTGVIDLEDGAYQEDQSIPAASESVTIAGNEISGGTINIDASYISAIYAYSEEEDAYTISDVTINSYGMGGNDFGTNGGWGTVVNIAGNTQADLQGLVISTDGPLHDGIWAGGTSVVDVRDTVVIAKENAEKYGFTAYDYDKYTVSSDLLSDEELAEVGLSGEYVTVSSESSGEMKDTYYYYNENWTSNFSAPMLQCVPLALGLYGSMRATCCFGQATLSFYDSLVLSDSWAVLSTDSGNGTLNATDTVGIIGEVTEEADAELSVEVNGETYFLDPYDTSQGSGYVTYCDGFTDNFYGCQFYAPDYLAILTGGTFTYTSSDNARGYGWSDRIGFMSHGNAYVMTISESDFDIADCFYTIMSTGAVDITLDDVTVNWTKDNPWGGVLFQFMDTDDTGTDANDPEMDIVDLSYEEYLANTASSEGTTKTLVIKNSELTGDIYNSVGSSNNVSTLSSYDGSTPYLSSWSTSTVDVTLDNATLTGVISCSYAQHVDEDGNAIGGQFFFNKTGEPMDGDESNTYDYLTARRVSNTSAYNGIGMIDVTLENGAVWNVTGTSIINSLTVGDDCTVNGEITENEDGTLKVSPLA